MEKITWENLIKVRLYWCDSLIDAKTGVGKSDENKNWCDSLIDAKTGEGKSN